MRPRTAAPLILLLAAACAGRAAEPRAPAPRASESAPAASLAPLETSGTTPDEPVPAAVSDTAKDVAPDRAPSGPRMASRRFITWIYGRPSRKGLPIGYIRVGTWIDLKSAEKVLGEGCKGGWYEAKPFGFVCKEESSTMDPRDPLLVAMQVVVPRSDAPLPYRYALSSGAPMYGHVPTDAEQTKAEGPKEKRRAREKLGKWASGHEELATDETIAPTDEVPALLHDGKPTPTHHGEARRAVRKWIPNGSMLAYSHAFTAGGRTWLLSADLTVVPADRVRAFRVSTFHGVKLDAAHTLPAAWTRHDARPRYQREGEQMVPFGEKLPPRTFVSLGGTEVVVGGKTYLPIKDEAVFVRAEDVVVVKIKETLPISVGASDKWIEVHLRAGTLTAYEGPKAVFTTLVSPGAGGVGPAKGTNDELVKLSTTPLGTYKIVWKDRAAPMSPEKGEPVKFWIADVPYTQYFRAPFALHVAYWHEDFGMPKSAGCINVSPEDGRFLFGFSDPVVPPAWGGVGPGKDPGIGTTIAISP